MTKEYGVRYSRFKGKQGYLVTDEKFFDPPEKLERFVKKLEKDDNFNEIIAYTI